MARIGGPRRRRLARQRAAKAKLARQGLVEVEPGLVAAVPEGVATAVYMQDAVFEDDLEAMGRRHRAWTAWRA